MGLDRSTLGRNVRVLEGAGLLKLTEGADQRNRLVCLTEAGEDCVLQGRLAGLGGGTAALDGPVG
jgi:DNA-binding MarR family transcriptional regulator